MKKQILTLIVLLTISGKIFGAYGTHVDNKTGATITATIDKGETKDIAPNQKIKLSSGLQGGLRAITWKIGGFTYKTIEFYNPDNVQLLPNGEYIMVEKTWNTAAKTHPKQSATILQRPAGPMAQQPPMNKMMQTPAKQTPTPGPRR